MKLVTAVFALVALLLLGGAGRLAYIEYSEGAALRDRAAHQQSAIMTFPPLRGDILDARGRVLAGTSQRPSIFVDPSAVDDPAYLAFSVAPILGLDAEKLEAEIREGAGRGFVWVKRDVSEQELAAFKIVRNARNLRAFGVQTESKREYLDEPLAGQILGFVGGDGKGAGGVELLYDEQLRGEPGFRKSTVDVQRRRLRQDLDDYRAPVDGASVILTIDTYIQQFTERYLEAAVTEHKAEWGAAIVMDSRTGEILAMANVPRFNPKQPVPAGASEAEVKSALELMRNRAISFSYEPGSTFKPFVASSALNDGIVRLGEIFAINGPRRQFGSRTINDTHAYSSLMLEEIISKSSNIGMGLIGARCGNDRIYRYVRSFGFGDYTGIGLPGEEAGQLNDLSRWTSFSTQSVPIGQEISVTAIQLVTAFNVFCTDGVLLRPRIVRGIVGPDGRPLWDNSNPIPIRRVLEADAARKFRLQSLVQTVVSGTGKTAAIPDYQVFGKTGTAQIADPRRGYVDHMFTASFVCGAPAGEPRLACVVSVYKPTGPQHYGGQVSAPVAGKILADTLKYMHIPTEQHYEPIGAGASSDRD